MGANILTAPNAGFYVNPVRQISAAPSTSGIAMWDSSSGELTYGPQLWFRGGLSSDQSLTAGQDNDVNWTSNNDPLGWWNGTTKRCTPGRSGWYIVTTKFNVTGISSSNQINTQIRVNGVNNGIAIITNNSANYGTIVNTGMFYLANTTDYFNFTIYPAGTGQSIQSGQQGCTVIVQWMNLDLSSEIISRNFIFYNL